MGQGERREIKSERKQERKTQKACEQMKKWNVVEKTKDGHSSMTKGGRQISLLDRPEG